MRISEFAKTYDVTPKLLRHYDEIGLLRPSAVDPDNGYRIYAPEQGKVLKWILVLKQLNFSLLEIKMLLTEKVDQKLLLAELAVKREQITDALNDQLVRRLQIDKLIQMIEVEGFSMDQTIDLMRLTPEGVHEIKKYMPNTEMFLEAAKALLMPSLESQPTPYYCVLRMDLSQFKRINDLYGFDIGDKIIVAAYQAAIAALKEAHMPFTLGRAGGDEFTALVKGSPDAFEAVGRAITANMKAVDFAALGCPEVVQFYVSGIYAPLAEPEKLRHIIDATHETLCKSKRLGVGETLIEAL